MWRGGSASPRSEGSGNMVWVAAAAVNLGSRPDQTRPTRWGEQVIVDRDGSCRVDGAPRRDELG